MRPGCTKVETRGSLWWFDDTAHEYLRLPRVEQPRERPEWSDERAGVLQDAVWHPMLGWRIDAPDIDLDALVAHYEKAFDPDIAYLLASRHAAEARNVTPGLMIDLPDGTTTWAPEARIASAADPGR